ncbi:MAG: hypothetical protein H7338_17580, partial [Candidatus Sericytochromatia bacterium]|nr:hypothetical protein [Candidatus Sericytochromatia bacterium]
MAVDQVQRTFGVTWAALGTTQSPAVTTPQPAGRIAVATDSLQIAGLGRRIGIPTSIGLLPTLDQRPSGLVAPADAATLRDGVQGVGGVAPVVMSERLNEGVPATLRLGMAVAQSQAVIGVATPATVGGYTLAPGHSYQFKLTDAGVLSIQNSTGPNQATAPMPARIEPADGGATLLAGRRYRGALEIIA